MLRLLADHNFNHRILRALIQQVANLDVLTTQEAGLHTADDPEILELAAQQDRLVLTHDVNTMTAFAYARVREPLPMPGLIVVPDTLPVSVAIADLSLLIQCSLPEEWTNQVCYIPLTR